jgi:hypothetical protein
MRNAPHPESHRSAPSQRCGDDGHANANRAARRADSALRALARALARFEAARVTEHECETSPVDRSDKDAPGERS